MLFIFQGNILVLLPGLDDILAVRVALQNALRLGVRQYTDCLSDMFFLFTERPIGYCTAPFKVGCH